MHVTFSQENNRYEARCSFEERVIPKSAGFRWDATSKIWYTPLPQVVQKLRSFLDEKAKAKLSSLFITREPWQAPLEVPSGLQLYPFQEKAIRFALERNRSYLGLDPGLGKTACAAVIASTLKYKGIVYICPPFLTNTVVEEFRCWAPNTTVITVSDTKLKDDDDDCFTKLHDLLIVDEAHRFKNPTAIRTKSLFEEWVPYFKRVVFMSGTPMPNSPIELYPVLSNAAPETIEFKTKFEYGRRYCAAHQNKWGWDFSGASNMKELHEKVIGPFMIRMKKKDVLPELPPKTESMVFLEDDRAAKLKALDSDLLKMYSPTDLMKKEIGEEHIASYRRELGIEKVPHAVEFIRDILEETEESILIFAIHKDVIKELSLALHKYKPFVVTGDTRMDARKEFVDAFQEGKSRVFIGNIQAAGTGFTLTKASRVIFVEFSWTPGDNDQASDRAHRIGTEHENILIHYLVYRYSVDKAVLETNLSKRKVTAFI